MNDVSVHGVGRKRALQKLLVNRAQIFTGLVKAQAPKEVLGMSLVSIVKVGVQLHGPEFFFRNLGFQLQEFLTQREGLCDLCVTSGKKNPNLAVEGSTACQSCLDEINEIMSGYEDDID